MTAQVQPILAVSQFSINCVLSPASQSGVRQFAADSEGGDSQERVLSPPPLAVS